jgi:hypothetical protein
MTPPRETPSPSEAPSVNPTQESLRALEQEVSADAASAQLGGIWSRIKNSINDALNSILESPGVQSKPYLVSLINTIATSLGLRSPATPASTAGSTPSATPAYTPHDHSSESLPRGEVDVPATLVDFTGSSDPRRSGWYNFRGKPVYIEYNPSPRDNRDRYIKIPRETVEYFVGEGYRFNLGQSMGEYAETHLLASVTLPSSFTYDSGISRQITLNRRVIPKYNQVFREIERRNLPYHVNSTGTPFSWRNSRGPGASGLLSDHARGFALDLNCSDNPYGHGHEDSISPQFRAVLAVFREYGFTVGADWDPPDWMHVEYTPDGTSEPHVHV